MGEDSFGVISRHERNNSTQDRLYHCRSFDQTSIAHQAATLIMIPVMRGHPSHATIRIRYIAKPPHRETPSSGLIPHADPAPIGPLFSEPLQCTHILWIDQPGTTIPPRLPMVVVPNRSAKQSGKGRSPGTLSHNRSRQRRRSGSGQSSNPIRSCSRV